MDPVGSDAASGVLKLSHSSWPFGDVGEGGVLGLALAAVRDLRERRAPASPAEVAEFETDVLAGFVLARAAAGLADSTIRADVGQLEQVREWSGRPLWELEPTDVDAYFGRALQKVSSGARLARAQALTTYFAFVELRHKVEIHAMTGRVVACSIDEMNRPHCSNPPPTCSPQYSSRCSASTSTSPSLSPSQRASAGDWASYAAEISRRQEGS
jgi:hypothetical protein